MNFLFAGGSVGHNFGECIIKAAETCTEENLPLVIFTGVRWGSYAGRRYIIDAATPYDRSYTNIQRHKTKTSINSFCLLAYNGRTKRVLANICDFTLAEHDTDLIAFAGRRVIEGTLNNQEVIPPISKQR